MGRQNRRMQTPSDRYLNDPSFKSLVDSMVSYMYQSGYSPSEMREATEMACTVHKAYCIANEILQCASETCKKIVEVKKL